MKLSSQLHLLMKARVHFTFDLKKLNDQTANNHFLLIQDNNLSIYNKVKADP